MCLNDLTYLVAYRENKVDLPQARYGQPFFEAQPTETNVHARQRNCSEMFHTVSHRSVVIRWRFDDHAAVISITHFASWISVKLQRCPCSTLVEHKDSQCMNHIEAALNLVREGRALAPVFPKSIHSCSRKDRDVSRKRLNGLVPD